MFLGMRGTGDWVADQRPLNWRQNILYLYPNGMAPLTAILSMMSTKKVDDSQFHWWTEQIGSVGGAVTGIFTLPDLSVAYVAGGVAGDVLYAVVTAVLGNRIRAGHEILLRDANDYRVDVVGKVWVREDGSSFVGTLEVVGGQAVLHTRAKGQVSLSIRELRAVADAMEAFEEAARSGSLGLDVVIYG